MSLRVCVLASSSKGNSFLVATNSTHILVDAGLSGKKIFSLLNTAGFSEQNLDGIVVTHGHTDHISGAGIIARKLKIPVYTTMETYRLGRDKLKSIPQLKEIYSGRSFSIGDIDIMPFPTFHDAPGAVALVLSNEDKKLGILTDIGHFTKLALERLSGCTTLVLEANYCPKMLREGPYPWATKQRIQGRKGHLSNFDTCKIITQLHHRGLKRVLLSHISENNNAPEVVKSTLNKTLSPDVKQKTEFIMTFPDKPTKVVSV